MKLTLSVRLPESTLNNTLLFFSDMYISDFLHFYALWVYKNYVFEMCIFFLVRTDNMIVFIWEGWLL